MSGAPDPSRSNSDTSIMHITALDGIMNVNSLFTFAVFIGFASNPLDPSYTFVHHTTSCATTPAFAEALFSFQLYAFTSFLFSSLVALSLKQAILFTSAPPDSRRFVFVDHEHTNRTALRVGFVASGAGSVSGCVFLMLAIINIVQIKLGILGCENSHYSYSAVVPLLIFVPIGLLIYVCAVLFALTR